jgi:hypothetical protein
VIVDLFALHVYMYTHVCEGNGSNCKPYQYVSVSQPQDHNGGILDGSRLEILLLYETTVTGHHYFLLDPRADAISNAYFIVNTSISKVDKRFAKYHETMASFSNIEWNVDIHRRQTPGSGKGIFALRLIPKKTCVALYFGHLVDSNGNVVVNCPFTEQLFLEAPQVKRPFSKSHCVRINKVGLLMVDGESDSKQPF